MRLSIKLLKSPICLFLMICAAVFQFVSAAGDVQVTTSKSELTTGNSTVTTTQEPHLNKYRRVRNSLVKYGGIYRGNSSSRSVRAFTRRPKISRREKHRHSTKVDTRKLPVVLLPPYLTFGTEKNAIEKKEPFVINVVSPEPSTTSFTDFTASSNRREYTDTQETTQSSSRPYVDEKIMAMKNFGVRMRGRSRGDVKYNSTPRPTERNLLTSSDYTPPPTQFPSVEKLKQVGRQSFRRRSKARTTSSAVTPSSSSYPTDGSAQSSSPEFSSPSNDIFSTQHNQNYATASNQPQVTSDPPDKSSSSSDVLNYDIQRTSPRLSFSADPTEPSTSRDGPSTPSYNPNPQNIQVSSPSPFVTTHLDDFFSNVPQVSSSFVPRTEVNVATSTSQFVDPSTPTYSNEDYDLKDFVLQPLDILAPPYLEDEFHDAQGNVVSNFSENSREQESQPTPPPVTLSSIQTETSTSNELKNISTPSNQNVTQNYDFTDYDSFDGNSISSNSQFQVLTPNRTSQHQFSDCENGDCQTNQTFAESFLPVAPSDIKVLSDLDGIALINRMYENLLRVLNGGPDYYDLQEDPQYDQIGGNQIEPQDTLTLVAEESGDIRNSRQRGHSRNEISSSDDSPRKEDSKRRHDKSQPKTGKTEKKATQLCNSKLGYVADVSSGCKKFYVCTEYGIGEPMLCPNGTLFNQDYLVCDWWYNVECS